MMKLFVTLLCTHTIFTTTHAWGKEGHEIVANLAWSFLSNATQAKISDLLGFTTFPPACEGCSPLAVIADWADAVRHTQHYQWTAPLHYIDVRDDLIPSGCPAGEKDTLDERCHFDYVRDCPQDFCVAGSIVNYTNILMTTSNHNASVEALKFLTHFVGDIHQPLHASRTTDRGGNSIHVHFDGEDQLISSGKDRRKFQRHLRGGHPHAKTLHGIWDDDIIEKAIGRDFHGSRVMFEEFLQAWLKTNKDYVRQWLACPIGSSQACTSLWGEESFHYAIEWAYRNVDGSEVVDGDVLSDEYQQTRRPIVEQRLAAGGLRLAVTLEMALYGTALQADSFLEM
ncbi:hypothetical protein FisN_1Lh571 [Fistulifera solaris]|uniref:Aspergillus nuclease S(1) n=1 Tax=Fistulifera solaris TaxID=1519565 RepID=A0A1Z5K133_FISSO|nr:hypothetical protein FisN_1Lh571 [Fistulifera solaris]|eukprot:GAX19957.1 hypothetical protein FisN_1Lh571 [Fistulifera solaris]